MNRFLNFGFAIFLLGVFLSPAANATSCMRAETPLIVKAVIERVQTVDTKNDVRRNEVAVVIAKLIEATDSLSKDSNITIDVFQQLYDRDPELIVGKIYQFELTHQKTSDGHYVTMGCGGNPRPINNSIANSSTPTSTIEHFYRAYIAKPSTMEAPRFSKAFLADQKANTDNCTKYAGTDICGWAADQDPYMNTQEGEAITYESCGFTAKLLPGNVVEATFNVWPSMKDAKSKAYYTKHVFYKMVQENGAWVVDDVRYSYDKIWARQQMREENAAFRANPGPVPEK